MEDRMLKPIAHRKAFNFMDLMQVFRHSLSTELRDKVYSLCGLLPKNSDGAQRNVQSIVPDYNKPVEEVYLEAAWFQLRWMNSLDFLGHVQDSAQTRVKNLTSLVPDYSVSLRPNSLSQNSVNRTSSNHIGVAPFSAAAGYEFTAPSLSQPSPTLSLQGVVYDIVADVGEFNKDQDLSAIMNLLSGLPHVYWSDVLKFAQKYSAEEDGGFTLMINGGYLKGAGSLLGQFNLRLYGSRERY
jgi:hypothetical protein